MLRQKIVSELAFFFFFAYVECNGEGTMKMEPCLKVSAPLQSLAVI